MKITSGKACLIAAILLLQACSAEPPPPAANDTPDATAAGPSSSDRSVPLQTFIADYVNSAVSGGYEPDIRLRVPAIWLYSPDGTLFKQIDQDGDLPKIPSYLASDRVPASGKKRVPFSLIQNALASKTDAPLSVAPDGKRWIALLLLIDPGCGDRCPHYRQTLRDLEKTMPDKVQTMTLMLAK